jgi:hypothetical protein
MGERQITAASDVYALGCVAYEMLTGVTLAAVAGGAALAMRPGSAPAVVPPIQFVPQSRRTAERAVGQGRAAVPVQTGLRHVESGLGDAARCGAGRRCARRHEERALFHRHPLEGVHALDGLLLLGAEGADAR